MMVLWWLERYRPAARPRRKERSVTDDTRMLNGEQLDHLARYFNEEVTFSKHIGAKVEEVEPGRSTIAIDVEDIHLNGGHAARRGLRFAHRQRHGPLGTGARGREDRNYRDERPFPRCGQLRPHNLRERGTPSHPPHRDGRSEGPRRGRQPRGARNRGVPGLREEGQRDRLSGSLL